MPSLADHISAALPELRAQAESLMVTPCTITRTGARVLDENTGNYTTPTTVIYAGGCQIAGRDTQVMDLTSGSADIDALRAVIKVPFNSGPYRKGDIVTADGRTFKVEGPDDRTWQKSQKLPVVEVI